MQTKSTLDDFFASAQTLFTKSRLKKERTNTGIKDTIQEHFLEQIFKAVNEASGKPDKVAAIRRTVSTFPENITSPVWRLAGALVGQQLSYSHAHMMVQGLDPHHDTPVEILHVGLLGFVKYFWRDVVHNQLKGKDDMKELLIRRLSAMDVSGLGLSGKLNGKTLVQYAGSLTGRDFRALAQCAPFCIYDMVNAECFAAWEAMSSLVPLIWQPRIDNIHDYLVSG